MRADLGYTCSLAGLIRIDRDRKWNLLLLQHGDLIVRRMYLVYDVDWLLLHHRLIYL